MQQVLTVRGMSCNHCKMAITQAVKDLDPKASVHVDLAKALVEVESGVGLAELSAAIEEAGYEVIPA